jgi:hypothetical protein
MTVVLALFSIFDAKITMLVISGSLFTSVGGVSGYEYIAKRLI